jgi:hypothetical protein
MSRNPELTVRRHEANHLREYRPLYAGVEVRLRLIYAKHGVVEYPTLRDEI